MSLQSRGESILLSSLQTQLYVPEQDHTTSKGSETSHTLSDYGYTPLLLEPTHCPPSGENRLDALPTDPNLQTI